MSKILIIEDDKALCQVIDESLKLEHYLVEMSYDGADAIERLRMYEYDLVILDWDIPFLNGIEVCRQFRAKGGHAPVLMLTGKSKIDEKELGFNSGVDDYLTKPFELRELKSRIKALLRRPLVIQEETLQAGGLAMEISNHRVIKEGKEIHLSPKEFAVLELLMRYPNKIFSAEDLLKSVWKAEEEAGPETVKTHIKNLRAKIDSKGQLSLIHTVFGVGYKLENQGAS